MSEKLKQWFRYIFFVFALRMYERLETTQTVCE